MNHEPISDEDALTKMKLMFPNAPEEALKALVAVAMAMDLGKTRTVEAMGAVVDLHDLIGLKTFCLEAPPLGVKAVIDPWTCTVSEAVRLYAVQGQIGTQVLFSLNTAVKPLENGPTRH
jgi:hypothetical protein